MPKDYARTDRVAEQIQRELAELLRKEVKDPRVQMITLTGVEVTRDYAHAKVFYTTLGSPHPNLPPEGEGTNASSPAGGGLRSGLANKAVQEGLERASGFLRSQLAHAMKLRITPQLHFVYDASVEYGAHLSQLIEQAVASDKAATPPSLPLSGEEPAICSSPDKGRLGGV